MGFSGKKGHCERRRFLVGRVEAADRKDGKGKKLKVEYLITCAYEKHRINLFATDRHLLRIAGKENGEDALLHGNQHAFP